MSHALTVPLVYFGKIRSRGDFVRSGQQSALIHTLDRWLSEGIALMAADARWKEIYDHTEPLHFAFVGMRSRTALAGHLLASVDSSGRRFPFIAGAGFEVGTPEDFVARSPMVLARPWHAFEKAAQQACGASDADRLLAELSSAQVTLDTGPGAYEASYRDFIELQSLGALQALFDRSGHRLDLRLTLLALGLLLEPVRGSRKSQLEKGLRLPLPADALYQPLVATWWLELVGRFLHHADFELALFVSRGAGGAAPMLSIGFSGGSPAMLHAALDPQVGAQVFVDLREAEWAEELARHESVLSKLSDVLQQPRLTLKQARTTFREAFLGE